MVVDPDEIPQVVGSCGSLDRLCGCENFHGLAKCLDDDGKEAVRCISYQVRVVSR